MQSIDTGSVGFIGLGAMGKPMARRLVAAGFALQVFDVRSDAMALLVGLGARPAKRACDAAAGTSVVITMLPDTSDVETVFTGPGGLIDGLARDQVVIDMSTISPSASRRFAALVEAKGASALDAPVSGGVSGAESGRLSIMVGGAPEVLEKVRRVLEVLGTTITYVGGPGAGQAAKLCNQVVVALNLQAVCEGFSLGRGLGLDLETLRQILAGGSAGSWMLDNLAPKMILDDTAAGFRIDLQIKDLRLALEASMEAAIPLPGMSLATSLFVETKAHGEGRFGNQALYRAYERLSNRPWRDGPASPSPATISNGEDAA